jgi:aminomethyltransferase
MLAVQGPEALALVQGLTDVELPSRMRVGTLTVAGIPNVIVCATGYTGEEGVELMVPWDQTPAVWDALLNSSKTIQPIGLGARDTLRLEVCYHLYGNDLSEDRGPIEAGLGWCCKEETGFIGSEAVKAVRERGPSEKLAAFVIKGGGIARAGNEVVGGGIVTSGTFSPSLEVGIGMAYLPAERAVPGTEFEIDVRGKIRQAEVKKKPLYVRESKDS